MIDIKIPINKLKNINLLEISILVVINEITDVGGYGYALPKSRYIALPIQFM